MTPEKSIKLNENSSNALKIQNPCHRKIYIPMETDTKVKVGMKEILQHPTKNSDGTLKQNPPIPVYDTSGPYSDDNYEIGDIRWVSCDDAVKLIRPYYQSKINIIHKIFLFSLNLYEETRKILDQTRGIFI